MLERGETTPLTRRSLALAKIDGDARERGVSLFAGLTIPASHWPGSDPPPQFDTVKIKSIDRIPDRVRLRIDFNARLRPEEFMLIAEGLPSERIDFVEDPCPYDGPTWVALREQTGLPLALDRLVAEEGVDILIVKPAIQDIPETRKSIVVTSYMDHPVGQLFSGQDRSDVAGLQDRHLRKARIAVHHPRSDALDRLADDADRLAHLLDAHQVPVVRIAVLADRDLELHFVVGFVGLRFADVPLHAGAAQQGSGRAERDRILLRQHAHALRPFHPDAVGGEQLFVLVDLGKEVVAEGADFLLEPVVKVVLQAADAKGVGGEPGAAVVLENLQDLFSFAESVEDRSHGAQVERVRAQPQKVAGNALQLGEDHACVLRARRQLHPK